jgi:hypothetical protein
MRSADLLLGLFEGRTLLLSPTTGGEVDPMTVRVLERLPTTEGSLLPADLHRMPSLVLRPELPHQSGHPPLLIWKKTQRPVELPWLKRGVKQKKR